MSTRRLQVRGNLESVYTDVFTPEAIAALEALAGFDADRKAVMQVASSDGRRGLATGSGSLSSTRRPTFRARTSRFRMRATALLPAARFPRTSSASGFRAPVPPPSRNASIENSIRNVAYALLSGADGWMFDGEDALGQIVDDVAGQPAQPQAGHPSRSGVHEGRRTGGRRNEQMGARASSDAPTIADWKKAARLHDQDLPRARPAPRRSPRPPRERRRLFRVHRRCGALHREQPPGARASRLLAGAVPAEDPDRRGSRAVERHSLGARKAPWPAGRHDQGATCSSSRSKRASS